MMKLTAEELNTLHRVADALHAGNGPRAAEHFMCIPWNKLIFRFGGHMPLTIYNWMKRI